jgi:pimeloyl-ACP methyl ester carboxylesterase
MRICVLRKDSHCFASSASAERTRSLAALGSTLPSASCTRTLVAGKDKTIPPELERWMYHRANARKIVEVATSSHVAMISQPETVANLIERAAKDVR